MSMKTTGLEGVLRALEVELPTAAREVSGELFRDVAKAIADEARERAPVRTGALRNAIKSRKSPSNDDAAEVYVQRQGRGDPFYWRFLEYGQGPGGVEYAMFLKAREAVMGDGRVIDKFRRRLTAKLKRI